MTRTEELAYTSRTTGWRDTPQAGKPSPATVQRGILTATFRGAIRPQFGTAKDGTRRLRVPIFRGH